MISIKRIFFIISALPLFIFKAYSLPTLQTNGSTAHIIANGEPMLIIVTDGVFSMDDNVALVDKICELKVDIYTGTLGKELGVLKKGIILFQKRISKTSPEVQN